MDFDYNLFLTFLVFIMLFVVIHRKSILLIPYDKLMLFEIISALLAYPITGLEVEGKLEKVLLQFKLEFILANMIVVFIIMLLQTYKEYKKNITNLKKHS